MEGHTIRTTQVPSGTKSLLQRMVLKDIKNDPTLTSGSHDPVCFWKGQATSDSEGKSLFSQQLGVTKINAHCKDDVWPLKKNLGGLPACNSKSFVLSKGSFFSDPISNTDKNIHECAEAALSCTNKYFRTPTTSKGKVKRKLSPVMEQDTDSNTVQGSEGRTVDVGCEKSQSDRESWCKMLLDILPYRSSFAIECQEIVKQIKEKNNQLNPGESKAKALDISYINSESPPYDSTSMISDVSNVSSFGVSLLHLGRTDMQLPGSDCSNNVTEGIFYMGSKIDEGCGIKRQKMEPSSIAKADTLQCQSINSSTANVGAPAGFGQISTSPCERIPLNASQIMEENGVCKKTTCLKYKEADTLHANPVVRDIACQWSAQVTKEEVNKQCANTTHEIYQLTNITQEIEPAPQQLNTRELSDVLQNICNVTQDIIQLTNGDCKANSTIELNVVPQHMESYEISNAADSTWEVLPTSVKLAGESLANTTQVTEPQTVGNITQDIVAICESSIANTTQVIALPSLNTTVEIVSVHESSSSVNTTQVIQPVPENTGNMTQDEGKAKETSDGTVNIAETEVIANIPSPENKIKLSHHPTEGDGFVHEGDKPDISATNSIITPMDNCVERVVQSPKEIKGCLVSPKVDQSLVPTSDVVNENRKLSGSPKHSLNVADFSPSPEKENIIPNKAEDICVTNGEEQAPVSDMACTNNGAPVSMTTQSKPDSLENSRNEANDIENCGLIGSSQNKGSPSKMSKVHLLDSGSCSMIQEESANDVSVFSFGSLSFVTSTPVAGLNMFPFQKSCKDSEPQDPNISLVCVMEPPQKKDLSQDSTTTQFKLMAQTNENESCKFKSKMESGLPTNVLKTQRQSRMSGIPITRRSPAVLKNPTGQSAAKEPTQPKIPSKGMPVKVTFRPPLAQKSLPRASLENAKQNKEGKVGNMPPSKIVRSSLKTSKVGNLKPTSAPISQLSNGSSLSNTLSQPCTPSRSSVSRTHNVSCLPVPAPGIHTSGLQIKRTQREIPSLISQKRTLLAKEGQLVNKQLKPPSFPAPTSDATSKFTGKPNIQTTRTQKLKAEPSEKGPLTSGESFTLPPAMSELEKCCHVQTCNSCQGLLTKLLRENEKLLQENEDLRRQVSKCDGQVQHGSGELPETSDH